MHRTVVWLVDKIDLQTFEHEQQIGLAFTDREGVPVFMPLSGREIARLANNLSEVVRRRPDVLSWKQPEAPR